MNKQAAAAVANNEKVALQERAWAAAASHVSSVGRVPVTKVTIGVSNICNHHGVGVATARQWLAQAALDNDASWIKEACE